MGILKNGAERIANNDLNFKINYEVEDEFGHVCQAFEKMRSTLEESSKETWRQMEENIPVTEDMWMRKLLYQDDDFNFEEERLATAYAELPLMRQQILKFLYVDELTVGEIAKKLHCSAQYVSDQKQKGLKHLRKKMSEGGDDNG